MSFEFKDKKQVEKDDIHRARKAGFFTSVVFYLIPILGFMNVWAVAVRPAERLSAQSGPKTIFKLHAFISLFWWLLFVSAQMVTVKESFILGLIFLIACVYAPIHYTKYLFKFKDAANSAGHSYSDQ